MATTIHPGPATPVTAAPAPRAPAAQPRAGAGTGTSSGFAQALVFRGILAGAFGVALLAWTGPTVRALVYLFGAFAIADGLLTIWTASRHGSRSERWPWVLSSGFSIAAGVVALVWPDISALALLYVIGAGAIVVGLVEVVAAIRLRSAGEGRTLLGLRGLLAVVFGVIMVVHPGAGAVAVVSLIAVMALCAGVTSIVAGFRFGRTAADARELAGLAGVGH